VPRVRPKRRRGGHARTIPPGIAAQPSSRLTRHDTARSEAPEPTPRPANRRPPIVRKLSGKGSRPLGDSRGSIPPMYDREPFEGPGDHTGSGIVR
jgi:hypothetical protein